MPKPKKGEKRKDFVSRCIPIVLKDGTAKDQDQAVAVCNSMWRRRNVRNLEHITTNLVANKKAIRREKLEGREHIVVPCVMLTEGVHEGNEGPLFYPAKELKKSTRLWNHRPIVLYHPTLNGKGISACDPLIMNSRKTGLILNTQYDNKLRSEAWLEESRMDVVDERIRQFIDNAQMMEVSTGLYVETDGIEGDWNGEHYMGTAYNHSPDHLALLPDMKGACSIEDGAGLLQLNELSHGTIRRQLYEGVANRLGTDMFYIEEVFDGFLIYSFNGKLYRMDYTKSDDTVTVPDSETPEEVQQVMEYRTKEGGVIGNFKPVSLDRKESIMARKEQVDQLIANTQTKWKEENRSFLMSLTDEQIGLMEPVANAEKDPKEGEQKPKEGEQKPAENPQQTAPSTQTPGGTAVPDGKQPGENKDNQMVKDLPGGTQQQPQQTPNVPPGQVAQEPKKEGGEGQTQNSVSNLTPQQLLQMLPNEYKEVHNYGVRALNARRGELVAIITNAWPSKFTPEQLAGKRMDDLEELADLAQSIQQPEEQMIGNQQEGAGAVRFGIFEGAGTLPVNNSRKATEVAPLPLPVHNWKSSEAG
jgi:hypothetical protein